MITWVTVWVLTMVADDTGSQSYVRRDSYQLTYATQARCVKQGEAIKKTINIYTYRCDFQQVPMVKK